MSRRPGPRAGQGPTRLAASCLLAAALACETAPGPLEVVARPLAWERPPGAGEYQSCGVADDYRPARGCGQEVRLEKDGVTPNGFTRLRVPRGVRRKDLVITRAVIPDDPEEAVERLPNTLRVGVWDTIEVRLPRPERGRMEARFYVSSASTLDLRARQIDIPHGAVLRGAVGIAVDRSTPRGPAVRFAISTASGEVLFERTLTLGEARSGWHEYSISLDDYAGREIDLHFTAEPTGRVGIAQASQPLFAVPRLLAPTPRTEAPHVIMISLDTLRADHVGAYGSRLPLTPNIDALAATGHVFENALTTHANTAGSHMSLFTGLYPSVHGVTGPGTSLDRGIRTLPQYFAGAGYSTHAVTENGMVVRLAGFGRGFDSYLEYRDARISVTSGHVDRVIDSALERIARFPDEKSFLFLHTYQVHAPYGPPAEFDRFQDAETGLPLRAASRAYAGEVLFTDHELRRLFEELRRTGLIDQTLLVILADHGEAFGDKGGLGHATLYEPVVRIPMIWHQPGRIPSGRSAGLVSLIDVLPTLLDWLGIDGRTPRQGTSQRATLEGTGESSGPDRTLFAEYEDTTLARRGALKWFDDSRHGFQLFDLTVDPGEQSPITTGEQITIGKQLLADQRARNLRLEKALSGMPAAATPVDRDLEGQLRALGYVD